MLNERSKDGDRYRSVRTPGLKQMGTRVRERDNHSETSKERPTGDSCLGGRLERKRCRGRAAQKAASGATVEGSVAVKEGRHASPCGERER